MNRAAPPWLLWLGLPCVGLACALAGRLVWEQTFWTWEHGPSMVGYTLGHSWLGLTLLHALLLTLLWPVAVLAVALEKRCIANRRLIAMLAVYGIAWLLMLVPFGTWQRLCIGRFSQEQATALLIDASADGDVTTVRAVLQSGIPVNAPGPGGTALHAAARQGALDTMAYLIDNGANVNALDAHGDSPLACVRRTGRRAARARQLLETHGGTLVQGGQAVPGPQDPNPAH